MAIVEEMRLYDYYAPVKVGEMTMKGSGYGNPVTLNYVTPHSP